MGRFVRWIQRVIKELRRRQVIRVAVVYAGTAFVILQLGEILVEPFGLPDWTLRMVTFLLVLGFPLAVGPGCTTSPRRAWCGTSARRTSARSVRGASH